MLPVSMFPLRKRWKLSGESVGLESDQLKLGGVVTNMHRKRTVQHKGGGDLNMNASTGGCRLFGFSLPVETPASNLSKKICTKWILYTDSENDMMVLDDDPWHDFCNVVLKIHLYTKEEVENANDDNKSCLEQAALMMETSKLSSVS
ncbi:hypothetical protein Bca52824_022648 [Brassica carinata]|uniref:Auxin-responsive protein n=1 Tax=Brassica carinata TaxID=52824 RepID=A0A8X7VH33_BRACI|nr:hypothetical protein Bca52824_022648 [Brassica carinata]